MHKFVIEKTKGNDEVIIKTFERLEDARVFGDAYAAGMVRSEGILTLAERDVDESGRPTSNAERIYQLWR